MTGLQKRKVLDTIESWRASGNSAYSLYDSLVLLIKGFTELKVTDFKQFRLVFLEEWRKSDNGELLPGGLALKNFYDRLLLQWRDQRSGINRRKGKEELATYLSPYRPGLHARVRIMNLHDNGRGTPWLKDYRVLPDRRQE